MIRDTIKAIYEIPQKTYFCRAQRPVVLKFGGFFSSDMIAPKYIDPRLVCDQRTEGQSL